MTIRLAAGTVALLLPLVAWHVGDDGAPAADTAATTTTTLTPTDQTPSTSIAPPIPGADATTTTTTSTSTTTTTTTATTTSASTSTSTTSTTTSTLAPTTTVTPSVPMATETMATTTDTVASMPPPATPPATPAPVPPPPSPAPPPDITSDPIVTTLDPPAGRPMVATGVADLGQMRPIAFPVAGPVRYSNDFGACRDGCRRQHKGNDLIGDRLQPLLAMRDGVVDRLLDHPTAGFGIVVRDADGWEYHLYHVNNDTPGSDDGADDGTWRFAPGIAPGSPVSAGQVIAWMGDSGNSEGSVPHAHVEIHTPDGRAINPYWSLLQAQRDADCALTTSTGPAPAAPTFSDAPGAESAATIAARLPGDWTALRITGGRPGAGATVARMWIGPAGFTPIDAAALWVGDPRLHDDCSQPAPRPAAVPSNLGAILATIRAVESGGDYTAEASGSTASGAYQFLDSSWAGYLGYRRARDAPPDVQDAKAVELATSILARNDGDVSTIPVSWYIGHVPRGEEWDRVPTVGRNTLTPRQYQERWLGVYERLLGTPEPFVAAAPWAAVDTSRTCRTVVVDLGPPERPELVLTQTRSFANDPAGRAVVAPGDPCDPHRTTPVVTTGDRTRRGSRG